MATARNVAIIVAISAVVAFLPGGGDSAAFVGAVLSTLITVAFAWIAARLYREHRLGLFSLGDQHRALLYGALGTLVFAMAALTRLFDEGGIGVLLWFALVGGASYALVVVYRHWRAYG